MSENELVCDTLIKNKSVLKNEYIYIFYLLCEILIPVLAFTSNEIFLGMFGLYVISIYIYKPSNILYLVFTLLTCIYCSILLNCVYFSLFFFFFFFVCYI